MPLASAATAQPAASSSAPITTVDRTPSRLMPNAGSGLDSPQASPSSEKLDPASAADQCRSAHMV